MNDVIFSTIKDADENFISYSRRIGTPEFHNLTLIEFSSKYPTLPYVFIEDVYVKPEFRRKGIGSKLLSKAIEANKDACILLNAGASSLEYEDEPCEEELIRIKENLRQFYERNGFTDVNGIFGQYQFQIPFLYTGNDVGMLVCAIINQQVKNIITYKE